MAASRIALITGASSGIGREVAIEYGRRGGRVVAMARTASRLAETVKLVTDAGGKCVASVGDVGKREDVRRAVETAQKEYGGLDVAIANAGYGGYQRVDGITEREFDEMFQTNVKGVIWTIQESLPLLRASKGRIVIVSSILGRVALGYMPLYCMSKFALTALADAARLELKPEGVSVTLVGPGMTATEFQARASTAVGKPPRIQDYGQWSPKRVAKKLVRAAECRRRAVYLSAGGKGLIWLRESLPAVSDWGITRWMRMFEKKVK